MRYDGDTILLEIPKLHLVDYKVRREIRYAMEAVAHEMLKDVEWPSEDDKPTMLTNTQIAAKYDLNTREGAAAAVREMLQRRP
jgi:hypothetical protein